MPSCVNLSSLRYLHLQGNEFSGPIPNALSKASSLVTLDLRDNKLSGRIPRWISLLSNLRVLLLRGNILEGPIPFQLCQLTNMNLIDLSCNNLSGSMPSCLQRIPYWKRAFDDTFATREYGWTSYRSFRTYSYISQLDVSPYNMADFIVSDEVEEVEFITKSRSESYSGNILYFFSGIDLSGNKFTGPIPPDRNGGLKWLGGEIPSELIDLNFLAVFTAAYNNLSGRTPDRKKQFATFEENSYEGNPLLCGLPLQRSCTISSALPSARTTSRSGQ
ncbi:unnamed protein product, partial [Ilex paraguariensis]